MNLIEQLGGYDNAKGILQAYRQNAWSVSDVCKGFHIAFTIQDLVSALLEYRRANNIFEVGDDVVFCNFLKGVSKEWLGETFKVIHVYEDGDVAVVSSSGVSTHLTLYTIKHATQQKIQCGHRLPSIQDIPPNSIVLER